jgi:hypothetical protein
MMLLSSLRGLRGGWIALAGTFHPSLPSRQESAGFEFPRKTRPKFLAGKILPSQSGLCLRELVGASWRVRRGPSLGDSTSAGAENSQVTQHAANATEGDSINLLNARQSLLTQTLLCSLRLKHD